MSLKKEKTLVYGDVGGSLLFFPQRRARDFAEFYKAQRQAKTWGEFRKLVPTRLLDEISDYDEDENPHADNAPFNPDDSMSIFWPFPEHDQVEFLPDDVIALGSYSDTGEGDRVDFAAADEAEIARKLRQHGYTVERDDALVQAAFSY